MAPETRQQAYPIGLAERDTGISRETLRVWERRYGFPRPDRDAKGERLYSQAEIERLRRTRALIDSGLRPSQVVPLEPEAFERLWAERSQPPTSPPQAMAELLDALARHDVARLDRLFERSLAVRGLRGFVLEIAAPLVRQVGEHWAAGELQIFEEHLLTRQLTGFLDTAASRLGRPLAGSPVLLATLPGEQHGLGLLMVEALLWSRRTPTLNLGTEVPIDQLVEAVRRTDANRLALSFSGAYPPRPAKSHLREVAERLPDGVELWAGGAGIERIRRLPPGVVRCGPLESI